MPNSRNGSYDVKEAGEEVAVDIDGGAIGRDAEHIGEDAKVYGEDIRELIDERVLVRFRECVGDDSFGDIV